MIDSLIKMINQISANVDQAGGENVVAERVAIHLRKFWARTMRQDIVAYVLAGGEGLDPVARLAVIRLTDEMQEKP